MTIPIGLIMYLRMVLRRRKWPRTAHEHWDASRHIIVDAPRMGPMGWECLECPLQGYYDGRRYRTERREPNGSTSPIGRRTRDHTHSAHRG